MRKLERVMYDLTNEELCEFMCGLPEDELRYRYEEDDKTDDENNELEELEDLLILRMLGVL